VRVCDDDVTSENDSADHQNLVSAALDLTLHCKSKEEAEKSTTLQLYEFRFRPNFVTVMTHNAILLQLPVAIAAVTALLWRDKCDLCFWKIPEEGPCRYDPSETTSLSDLLGTLNWNNHNPPITLLSTHHWIDISLCYCGIHKITMYN